VHRLPNPRVPLCSSRRGLCRSTFGSSIGSPNLWQSTDFSSAPARVFFPGEKPLLLCLGFLRFFVFPSMQGLPHSLLTFLGGGTPPPSVSPPMAPLFPLPGGDGGGRRWPAVPTALPRPTSARPSPAAVAAPCVAAPAAGQPDPTSPVQPPPLPLHSLPWMGGRR
jgi:hypothetical protein